MISVTKTKHSDCAVFMLLWYEFIPSKKISSVTKREKTGLLPAKMCSKCFNLFLSLHAVCESSGVRRFMPSGTR